MARARTREAQLRVEVRLGRHGRRLDVLGAVELGRHLRGYEGRWGGSRFARRAKKFYAAAAALPRRLDLLDDLDGVLVLQHVVLADLLRHVLDAAAPDQRARGGSAARRLARARTISCP